MGPHHVSRRRPEDGGRRWSAGAVRAIGRDRGHRNLYQFGRQQRAPDHSYQRTLSVYSSGCCQLRRPRRHHHRDLRTGLNLGLTTLLDGATTTGEVSLDTTTPGQHTIEYRAFDQSGLTSTSTRTVIVSLPQAANDNAPPATTTAPVATSTSPAANDNSSATTTNATSTAH